MKLSFALNGTKRTVEAEPGENLQALLQRIGIPSVRCSDDGEGFAGATRSSSTEGPFSPASSWRVRRKAAASTRWRASWKKVGSPRCRARCWMPGWCSRRTTARPRRSSSSELLDRSPEPTEDDIRDSLSGLFSRGTGYRAVLPRPWSLPGSGGKTRRSRCRWPRSSVTISVSSERASVVSTG